MGLNEIIQIGEVLKDMRRKRGINQSDMAEILGVGQSTYANYERNNRMPSDKVFDKIDELYGISAKELINKATSPKTTNDIFKTLADNYEQIGYETSYVLESKQEGNDIYKLYIRNTSDETRLTVSLDVAKNMLKRLDLSLKEIYYSEINKNKN